MLSDLHKTLNLLLLVSNGSPDLLKINFLVSSAWQVNRKYYSTTLLRVSLDLMCNLYNSDEIYTNESVKGISVTLHTDLVYKREILLKLQMKLLSQM